MKSRLRRLLVERRSRSPTRRRSVLRHDQALLGAVLVQPIMMLLLFGFALSNKPAQRAVGRARPEPDARRRAASSRTIQATGYFVAAGGRRRATTTARRCCGAARPSAFVVMPVDFRRDVERGRPQVQVLLDGTDPLTAARVGGIHRRRSARPSTRRSAARRARARRAAPVRSICASASGSTRRCAIASSSSRRWPACCSRTSVCRRRASGSSASARAAPTSRCSRCRRRRSRSCSASSLPLRRRQLRACSSLAIIGRRARVRHLAARAAGRRCSS